MFFRAWLGMLKAIVEILLVSAVAGFMVRKKILTNENIKGLSEATIKVFLPALTFDKVLTQFSPYTDRFWWVLPLVGLMFPIMFMGITAVFYSANLKENLNKLPLASLQNVGYLVLPIGEILYPAQFGRFALYVFMLTLGFNIALWTVGKVLISRDSTDRKINFKEMITPPFVANVTAMVLVFLHLNKAIPQVVLQPIQILSNAAVPLGMFILGATLGNISIRNMPKILDIVKLTFVKFVLMPVVAIGFILLFKVNKTNALMADLLVIESAAPPAANLIVIVKKYGGDENFVASAMLLMYLSAIVFMPLWLGIWKSIS